MSKVAIIAAAGWKGAGCRRASVPLCQPCLKPLATCPEPLLPLGDGTTPLSRLSHQLSSHGFKIVIAVGKLGSLYPKYVASAGNRWISRPLAKQMLNQSPWTRGRLAFAAEYGRTIAISKPDQGGSVESVCHVIDILQREEPLTRLLIVFGDTLFSDKALDDLLDLPFPFCLHRGGEFLFYLDAKGVEIYHKLAPRRPPNAEFFRWKHQIVHPYHQLQAELARTGVHLFGQGGEDFEGSVPTYPGTDLDTWKAYDQVLGMIRRGSFG